jgi:hypothetical protein
MRRNKKMIRKNIKQIKMLNNKEQLISNEELHYIYKNENIIFD